MDYRPWMDGTLSVLCWSVVVSCFVSLVRTPAVHEAFEEIRESGEMTSRSALYLCSLSSYLVGFAYASIASVLFFLNPQNLSVSQCYPVNMLPALWVVNKMLVHLFFVARLKLSFEGSSLSLSSLKTRMLVGSVLFINLSLFIFGLSSIIWHIEKGYSDETRDSISDIYSCYKATETIRHELLGQLVAIPLVFFDFVFSFIEVRMYVRRLWHLVENNEYSSECGANSSINSFHSGMKSDMEEVSMQPDILPSLIMTQMSNTLGSNSSGDSNNGATNANDHSRRPSITQSSHSTSDLSSIRREHSSSALSIGSTFIVGFSPMISRMRTIAESKDPNSRSFVKLATRSTTLALIAIISSFLMFLSSFVTSRMMASLDIAINGLCVYFTFARLASESCLNPCCDQCFRVSDSLLMPCLYLCCQFECCECRMFDCDHCSDANDCSEDNMAHEKDAPNKTDPNVR